MRSIRMPRLPGMPGSVSIGPLARATLAGMVGALLLPGCVSTRGIAPAPQPPTAEQSAQRAGLNPLPAVQFPSDTWWTAYGDAALNQWIDRALADSPGPKQAQARVDAARAQADLAGAVLSPTVAASADSTAERFSNNGIFPPPLGGTSHTLNDLLLGAAWQPDFFGRNLAAADAARLTADAAEVERNATRVELAAAVTATWFEIARAQQSRAIALAIRDQRDSILRLVRQRLDAGLDTRVELREAEGALPQIDVQIEQIDEQIALLRHQLATLAGQPVHAADGASAQLPAAAALLPPAQVPLELLARRPDIAAALLRIRAAGRSADAARADFYPNINLTAYAGFNAIGFTHLIQTGSKVWGVEPAISLPLFDAGRLRASLRGRNADAGIAVEAYNATVLDAARQVADALTSIDAVARQRAAQRLASEAAESAYDLSLTRYRAGLGTYLTVLTAETNVLAQRRLAADLTARAADLDVALVRSLGGGWHQDAAANVSAAPASTVPSPSSSLSALSARSASSATPESSASAASATSLGSAAGRSPL